ncbi:MAG: hypothetical protein MUF34_15495 [Polyangiaceae bacterium]|jgi:hypothetical protein|nr:hypothetical protein [Polyangiaceae bacterium]
MIKTIYVGVLAYVQRIEGIYWHVWLSRPDDFPINWDVSKAVRVKMADDPLQQTSGSDEVDVWHERQPSGHQEVGFGIDAGELNINHAGTLYLRKDRFVQLSNASPRYEVGQNRIVYSDGNAVRRYHEFVAEVVGGSPGQPDVTIVNAGAPSGSGNRIRSVTLQKVPVNDLASCDAATTSLDVISAKVGTQGTIYLSRAFMATNGVFSPKQPAHQ